MRRVRLDVLEKRDGRYFRDGEPFEGIAYRVEGDLVTANHRVEGGVLGGPAEAWDPSRLRVLGDAVREVNCDQTDEQYPEEGAYFHGELFEGVLYAFYDTGVLRAELDYHNEDPGPSREWYDSGAPWIENRRPRPDGTTESEEWDENGQSLSYTSLLWFIAHSPEGWLRVLSLKSGYPVDVINRVTFRSDFLLSLRGIGVTDEMISRLEDLHRVETLKLDGTTISAKYLECFRGCVNLRKIDTEGNLGFSDGDVQKLLEHLPNCKWVRR